MTVVNRIVDFLKNHEGETFTPKEIALSINANPNTVRGRLSELSRGKIKGMKITKLKKTKRASEWRLPKYLGKKISDYRLWKVSFKLIETLRHKKSNQWDSKVMNLEAHVIGIAPRAIEQQKVKNVVGTKLFSKVLDVMSENGVHLWNAINENKSVFIDATVINENPLDKKYSPTWIGVVEFVGSTGVYLENNISIDVDEVEW